MKVKKSSMALAASAAALVVGIGAQAAFATTTLSVDGTTSPGGPVSIAGTTYLPSDPGYLGQLEFETNFGVLTKCDSGTSSGTVIRGASGPVGTQVATIKYMTFSDCLATGLNFETVALQKGDPANWTVHTLEVPAKNQRFVNVEIRGIEAELHNDAPKPWTCAVNVSGDVRAQFDTLLDRLVIDTGSLAAPNDYPLVVDALDAQGNKAGSAESSCGGETWDGDNVRMKGTFQLDRNLAIS